MRKGPATAALAPLLALAFMAAPAAAQQTYGETRSQVRDYCHKMHREIERVWKPHTIRHFRRKMRREARVRLDWHPVFVDMRDAAPDRRWWFLRMYTYNLRRQAHEARVAARYYTPDNRRRRFQLAMRRLERLKARQIHNARRYGFGRCERAYFY